MTIIETKWGVPLHIDAAVALAYAEKLSGIEARVAMPGGGWRGEAVQNAMRDAYDRRDFAKMRELGMLTSSTLRPAAYPNSPHNSGMAADLLGPLQTWMRLHHRRVGFRHTSPVGDPPHFVYVGGITIPAGIDVEEIMSPEQYKEIIRRLDNIDAANAETHKWLDKTVAATLSVIRGQNEVTHDWLKNTVAATLDIIRRGLKL